MLTRLKIHEPMLRHSVIIHIWEQWAKEYEKATTHKIKIWHQDWAFYTEPINYCFHIWIDRADNYWTLTHEFYHLISQIREDMDLCEETWAYYMCFLVNTYLNNNK